MFKIKKEQKEQKKKTPDFEKTFSDELEKKN
jgi:hypothetical protein